MKLLFTASVVTALTLASQMAVAQGHAHEGDVEFGYENGELIYEGGPLFESEFETLDAGMGVYHSDEPGFVVAPDEGLTIGDGEWAGYVVTRPLAYHNGTSFAPAGASLTLDTLTDPGVVVDGTSGSVGAAGLIDQADYTDPEHLHEHLEFSIADTAPLGAYGLYLQLATYASDGATFLTDSDELLVVFNRGLDETRFDDIAVAAFRTTIPEPSSALLLMPALAVVARRRRG